MIVHGRTRQQGFKGSVSRAGIRSVVEAVDRIPVVANGDIRTIADVVATFEETGCAAVSIGRGAWPIRSSSASLKVGAGREIPDRNRHSKNGST